MSEVLFRKLNAKDGANAEAITLFPICRAVRSVRTCEQFI